MEDGAGASGVTPGTTLLAAIWEARRIGSPLAGRRGLIEQERSKEEVVKEPMIRL